jgi:hypothetical protein
MSHARSVEFSAEAPESRRFGATIKRYDSTQGRIDRLSLTHLHNQTNSLLVAILQITSYRLS